MRVGALSAILWNAASLFWIHTRLPKPKTLWSFFFFFLGLPTRKRTPSPTLISFSPLSQLGWTHTWKCWLGSTLGPNLVIQRQGSEGREGGGGQRKVAAVGESAGGREGERGSWGWKNQPPQDQKKPRPRLPNPTSALYKDLPPCPSSDSHAILDSPLEHEICPATLFSNKIVPILKNIKKPFIACWCVYYFYKIKDIQKSQMYLLLP